MTQATVVRYTTRPESSEANEGLIRAVFDELVRLAPKGLHYTAIRLEDNVSFIHVAVVDGDENPLTSLPAFRQFVSSISERCVEGPSPTNGTVIGAYQMGDDGAEHSGR